MSGRELGYVKNKSDIAENMEALHNALKEAPEEAKKLIAWGRNFACMRIKGKLFFAPSRFIGYKYNNVRKAISEHKRVRQSKKLDGIETTSEINKILGSKLIEVNGEPLFRKFCKVNKIILYNFKRKYWPIFAVSKEDKLKDGRKYRRASTGGDSHEKSDIDSPNDTEVNKSLEGTKKMITHLKSERNPRLRKDLLDRKWQEKDFLSCEMCHISWPGAEDWHQECQFEAHHKIPVSCGERETTVEDMALLCSCCHRFIHRVMMLKDTTALSIEEAAAMLAASVYQLKRKKVKIRMQARMR